ncbi:MAG: sugar phosphate isomerase/epimerase, partial [Bifidobacteriaceae bacterium]|nr:sugar phosphate isomerase/epimerase [Bifidobacteriaceae bacterium]
MTVQILLDPALMADQPVDQALAAAAAARYDGVELGNRPDIIPAYGPVALGSGDFRALGRRALSAGAPIESVAVIQEWASPDAAVRSQAVAWFRQGVEAAVELGASRINTELTGDPDQPGPGRSAWLRSWDELAPLFERHGLALRVEPHPGDFIETTVGALALLQEAAHPALGYLHCLPHTFYLGGSITEQLAAAAGRVDHLHLADSFRPERTVLNPPDPSVRIHQHFDIGWGELNWREAKTALTAFEGLATVQLYFWDERAQAAFAANRAAAAWLLGADEG